MPFWKKKPQPPMPEPIEPGFGSGHVQPDQFAGEPTFGSPGFGSAPSQSGFGAAAPRPVPGGAFASEPGAAFTGGAVQSPSGQAFTGRTAGMPQMPQAQNPQPVFTQAQGIPVPAADPQPGFNPSAPALIHPGSAGTFPQGVPASAAPQNFASYPAQSAASFGYVSAGQNAQAPSAGGAAQNVYHSAPQSAAPSASQGQAPSAASPTAVSSYPAGVHNPTSGAAPFSTPFPSETAPGSAQDPEPEEAKESFFTKLFKSKKNPALRAASLEDEKSMEELMRDQKWKKARRRLLGALMLLVAACIAYPLIFDKAPPPPTISIPLRIPKESSVDVSKIELPVPPVSQKQETKPSEPATPVAATVQPPSTSQKPQAPAASEAPSAAADKAAGPKTEPKAESKPEPKTESPKAEPPKPEVKKAESKPATEAGRKESAAETSSVKALTKGSFYIQVAALANKDKAQSMVSDMKKAGVSAFLAPLTTQKGVLYRVQSGPYKTRNEASAAAAKLAMAGLQSGKIMEVTK